MKQLYPICANICLMLLASPPVVYLCCCWRPRQQFFLEIFTLIFVQVFGVNRLHEDSSQRFYRWDL